MCLIHLRPRPSRTPSPDPIALPRIAIPAPPLSPRSYPPSTYSHPRPHSGLVAHSGLVSNSPRASATSDLKRLSIQSREAYETARRKEEERVLDAERERYEVVAGAPSPSRVAAAVDAPTPRNANGSGRRISFREGGGDRVAVYKDTNGMGSSPRTSGRLATTRPDVRRGSGYSYREGPVPASSATSLSHTATMPPPPAPPAPAPLSPKHISANILTNEAPKPHKPPHRRRESSVSVVNGRDGSVLERTTSGQLQLQVTGGHHRSGSLSARQRPSGGPRRSTGNVSTRSREGNGLAVGNGEEAWGKDPRVSARSVRERIVVVDEVKGTRRREYVRYEG